MFHFGLPSEKLDFPEDFFIKRYEKLLYFGSWADVKPIPIARNVVYVDTSEVSIQFCISEVKTKYSLSKEPKVVVSENGLISEVVFTWGENSPLTRCVLKFL